MGCLPSHHNQLSLEKSAVRWNCCDRWRNREGDWNEVAQTFSNLNNHQTCIKDSQSLSWATFEHQSQTQHPDLHVKPKKFPFLESHRSSPSDARTECCFCDFNNCRRKSSMNIYETFIRASSRIIICDKINLLAFLWHTYSGFVYGSDYASL